jgi:hypothetical protein
VKASGARAPEEGGVLTLTFAKWGPKQGAFNTKLYTAVYRPPAAGAGFMPQDSPPAQPPANHPRTQAQPGGGQRPEWVEARARGWTGGSSTLDAIQQKQQEDVPPF